MTTLFHASYEKVKRAERKFDNLKAIINCFINERLSHRRETDGDTFQVIASIKGDWDPDIGFEVVELVGHLRSALDKMISDVVVANNRGPSGVAFPFGGIGQNGNPEPFPTARHAGVEKKLTPEQWALVLSQKPYPGGNDTLWAVNTIANADKHGTGLVGMRVASTGRKTISNQPGRTAAAHEICMNTTYLDEKQMEAPVVTVKGGRNLQIETEVSGHIVFAEIMPVSHRNVLETLNLQIRLVKHIVKSFEPVVRLSAGLPPD